MIYIIDDKPERQKLLVPDLNEIKLIQLILRYDGELNIMRNEIFKNAKVIAIHDSFFKNPLNKHKSKSEEIIRKDLKEYCYKNQILLVFFSGDYLGYSERQDGSECQVGVTRFYKNLKHFVAHIEDGKEPILQILGFGENYKIEAILSSYTNLMKKIEANDKPHARIFLTDLCTQLKINDYKSIETHLENGEIQELIKMIDPLILSYYENISN